MTLPQAMLTSVRYLQSGACVVEEMHSGNGSASSRDHSTITIGVPSGLSAEGNSVSTVKSTLVRTTAWRCEGSASASTPVFGPRTSSKIKTLPGFRFFSGPGLVFVLVAADAAVVLLAIRGASVPPVGGTPVG